MKRARIIIISFFLNQSIIGSMSDKKRSICSRYSYSTVQTPL